jgi:hypothetical protein
MMSLSNDHFSILNVVVILNRASQRNLNLISTDPEETLTNEEQRTKKEEL